jgi:hypothetical protein
MRRIQTMRDRGVRIAAGTTAAGVAALMLLAPVTATASTKAPGSMPGLGPVAADEPADTPARDARGRFEADVLPEIDLNQHREPRGRKHQMPLELPDSSLVLERGRFRPLPDVPGAL